MIARLADISPVAVASDAAESLAAIRANGPAVHCITNLAATAFTANVLLALGAVPSLSFAEEEVADFAASAGALLVNLGTLDAPRRVAIGPAIEAIEGAGRSWVLDPVLVDRSPARLAFAADLVGRGPAIVRGNAREISALAEARGVASGGGVAQLLARASGACIALSGPEDRVVDSEHSVSFAGGHAWMGRVTAMGCALGAVMGAFLCVAPSPFDAAAQAAFAFATAGGMAAEKAQGPGSFQVAFLDALAALDADALARGASR